MKEFKGSQGVFELVGNEIHCEGKLIGYATNQFFKGGEDDLKTKHNAKLFSYSYRMLIAMEYFVRAIENEDIIIQENTDNKGLETTGQYLYQLFKSTIQHATE